MSLVSASTFLVRFDEFSGVPAELIQMILDESEQDCLAEFWEEKQARGVMQLTAHRLVLRWYQRQILAGAQTELEQSGIPDYAKAMLSKPAMKAGDEMLECTTYGMEFQYLKNGLAIVPALSLGDVIGYRYF